MKRNVIIIALAAVGMLATPAAAQYHQRDHRAAPAPTSVRTFGPATGAAGTTVTVYGQNFVRGTKIVFDGKLVEPSRLTSTSISFEIPRGSKDSAIALRVPGMRRDLAVGSFDVIAPKAPPRGRQVRGIPAQSRFERAFLADAKTKAELSLHADRSARLQRMLQLSIELRDQGLRARVEAAIAKEDARHAQKMKVLRANFRLV